MYISKVKIKFGLFMEMFLALVKKTAKIGKKREYCVRNILDAFMFGELDP